MSRRSVWAMVAGLLFDVILTTLIDVAFHAAKVYPPMKHALIGGAVGAGVIIAWNRNLDPHRYPILLVLTAIPLSWLGAGIFELQASRGVQRA